jgi:hypothetical protein
MAVDPAVILTVVGTSSLGAVFTAAKALVNERLKPKKTPAGVASPQGGIVAITITDSDGNTFDVSPTASEGKLIEKLVERRPNDQNNT